MERRIKKNKYVRGAIILFFILLIFYFILSIYFTKHFYFGTEINCISVSGKTEEEAEKEILTKARIYTLELEGRNGMEERIKGVDIGLTYNLDNKIKELKSSQNAFRWIFDIFMSSKYKIPERVSYDEKLLKDHFNNFSCFNGNNVIEPKNPSLQYTSNGYLITDEVYGNKVSKDVLYENIVNAITNGESKINLDSANCYENPKYTSKSEKVIEAKNTLDKYTSLTITYVIGDKTEVVDGSVIQDWLKVNEDFAVKFDIKEISLYVDKLADTYNTAGKTRDFLTSIGTTVKVGGGTYGWLINKSEEVKDLIKTIEEGESIKREPIYKQKAVSHDDNDIGDTYIEINMSKQHLWFYKKGFLVVEGDIVTGNIDRGNPTPKGIFSLQYKEKNATLKGENYRTSVKFWMPFYGNVGIHDANWRSSFGGNIYKTNGSHGCVNAPLYLANVIFNNIEEGTPIICYS